MSIRTGFADNKVFIAVIVYYLYSSERLTAAVGQLAWD
ncbi:MAG: hypothetical protein OFPI_12180 [Osedax symbiont Rs2]|nr:MAG: hypothetical protein OFPI_12180 [Osedax symbiont Rs2]